MSPRALPLLLAALLAALAPGAASACRCVQGVTDRLYQSPGAARVAVLLRSPQPAPGTLPTPAADPGWVEVQTHALRGKGFGRYRSRGTSCDLRVPVGGWFLLLSQGAPEQGFSLCDSVLVPLEDAGPLLAQLLPDPGWTRCRSDAECTVSGSPGCLPGVPVRREALRAVKDWRREVAKALQCGDAPPDAAGPVLARSSCQAGTCVLGPAASR
jgi:hypothetical protein